MRSRKLREANTTSEIEPGASVAADPDDSCRCSSVRGDQPVHKLDAIAQRAHLPEVGRSWKAWLRLVMVGLLCSGLQSLQTSAQTGQPPNPPSAIGPLVAELRIEGVINPVKARYVARSIERAREAGATLLLVSLDTPGGLVTSMQQIVTALTNAGIPVVGLVEPSTAQATSAGAFILLAADVAAMLPDARVGAAHPVGAGEELNETMATKATNSLSSLAKSLAERRGRSAEAAEAMVRDSVSCTASESYR